jgi:hypothetical protein
MSNVYDSGCGLSVSRSFLMYPQHSLALGHRMTISLSLDRSIIVRLLSVRSLSACACTRTHSHLPPTHPTYKQPATHTAPHNTTPNCGKPTHTHPPALPANSPDILHPLFPLPATHPHLRAAMTHTRRHRHNHTDADRAELDATHSTNVN